MYENIIIFLILSVWVGISLFITDRVLSKEDVGIKNWGEFLFFFMLMMFFFPVYIEEKYEESEFSISGWFSDKIDRILDFIKKYVPSPDIPNRWKKKKDH